MTVELTTETGTVRLPEAVHGHCESCHTDRDVTIMQVKANGSPPDAAVPIGVCGSCLVTALAVHFAARVHERAEAEGQDGLAAVRSVHADASQRASERAAAGAPPAPPERAS